MEERPFEACGLLSGRFGYGQTIWKMKNVERSPYSFAMDPWEIQQVLRMIALRGEQLVGIYHSHPTAPPIPSPEDIEYSQYRQAAYVIVSLARPRPEVGCFQITGKEAVPMRLVPF
jgi:proteasome lid subunit RPN8/RPN11